MTTALRIILIAGSVLTCAYILYKIRKSKMKTESSLFWFFFSAVLVILGIFPGIAEWAAKLLGVQSTVNLVFLVVIFLLVIRVFSAEQKIFRAEAKINQMTQVYAINRKDDQDKEKEEKEEENSET